MPSRAFSRPHPPASISTSIRRWPRCTGTIPTQDLVAGLTAIDNQLYVDPNRRNEFVRLMKEHGAVRGFESEIYRKDGSTMWISENARAVLDARRRRSSYFEGMVEDITERKRLETELHASRAESFGADQQHRRLDLVDRHRLSPDHLQCDVQSELRGDVWHQGQGRAT